MGLIFFFDTYALHGIFKSNQNYKPYISDVQIVLTRLNLMEFYYGIFITKGKEAADLYYDRLVEFAVDLSDEVIKKAMIFRAQNRNKKLSYVDCIGYIIAKSLNIKFLTGDKEFKNMENVEFVQ